MILCWRVLFWANEKELGSERRRISLNFIKIKELFLFMDSFLQKGVSLADYRLEDPV